MTLAWIQLDRAARPRTGAKRTPTGGAVWVALLGAIGCARHERPDPLAYDPRAQEARAITGWFGTPATDAGAAPAADASSASGAGAAGSSGGTSGASAATSGTSYEEIGAGAVLLRQIYEGKCDSPSLVQWGFFTYRALTPGDSTISFAVRSAATEPDLESATSFDLLTASTALGTARCGITGPAPCPLDLFVVLGGAPLVHHPIAELSVLLSAASEDGTMPSLEQWRLNYACTFNQ